MKKALVQFLIVVVSLIVGYYIGRSNSKKNVAVEFVYEGQTLTSQSERETCGEEPYGDSYVAPIKNGGAPDKPCGVGRADANPKLLLNDT